MGILNVTPDSFSDGGLYQDAQQAEERALQMIEQGADLLDIGGESTRPGAAPVSARDELKRVLPVLSRLAGKVAVPLSIDTRKPEVAREALAAGCSILNDVGGLRDRDLLEIAANSRATVVCMHMRGEPATMQHAPHYDDLLGELASFFREAIRRAEQAGIASDRIWIDPGIGFGKTFAHNLQIVRDLSTLTELGKPVVLGASRKSFLGPVSTRKASGEPPAPPAERRVASAVVAVEAARRGASILRVHDVAETRQALWTWASVEAGRLVTDRLGEG